MNDWSLVTAILLPALFAALTFAAPARLRWLREGLALLGTALNAIACALLYGKQAVFFTPWGGYGINFSLKLYAFSALILPVAAVFALLSVLYCVAFFQKKPVSNRFYAYLLLTVAMVNGALLANNLVVLLFFWEGILLTLFLMILLGREGAWHTAVKAVVLVGVSDLCMMLGIGLTAHLAGTLEMDQIHLPMDGMGSAAFLLLVVGALGKAGAMPFHTWIPDAADDAPMPFMALLPAALEKLLGVYLLMRVCVDLFQFTPGSAMSVTLMVIGACTILFAVMMALIQKDFKRLLSYHAISQVGYMILGIGTALPVGVIGGLFHMFNHATYKSCLFYTAGSVERQTGTTDLKALSGLGRRMPVTMVSFIIAAASIAGFPFTNGFYSKELIFDGALESGTLFYVVALAGAFFTAVSFLKLGHAAFFGKPKPELKDVKEAPLAMLVPMVALAALCLLMGFLRLDIIGGLLQPATGLAQSADEVIGAHMNWLLVGISAGVLLLAALSHWLGYRKAGSGLHAADHYHDAPVLRDVYALAERKAFDPYFIGGYAVRAFAAAALSVNNAISWFYDVAVVRATEFFSGLIHAAHNGSKTLYLGWTLTGVVLVAVILLASL
jgi:formate hydrogenlyase subunit 3/multisubunit Na+/H+ antiporter MnhD subunit